MKIMEAKERENEEKAQMKLERQQTAAEASS